MARRGKGGNMEAPGGHPWERRRGESSKAYGAFLTYRDLGPGRSLSQAAAELGRQVSQLKRWSSKHDWVARAAAWDADRAREEERLRREQRRQALEQQAEDAEYLRKLVRAFLKGLVSRDPETGELQLDPSIRASDAVRLYKLAGEIDQSLPQPQGPERGDDGSEVLAPMGTDELRAVLGEVRRQMKGVKEDEPDDTAVEKDGEDRTD